MRASNNIINNIAYTFFNYYVDDDLKKNVIPILKILDFDYNYEKGELIYEGCSPSLIYKKKEWEYPWDDVIAHTSTSAINQDIKDKYSEYHNRITPVKLSSFDIKCIEDVLNSNSKWTSVIFDAMGYIVREEGDTYRLHFVGGANYELWNEVIDEPIEPWNYDIEEEAIDWKTGSDWNDGFDLEKDVPKDWVDICEDKK